MEKIKARFERESGNFFSSNGEKIELKDGTILHFPKGFGVRMPGLSGGKMWGTPSPAAWTVTVLTKNGECGILIPSHKDQHSLLHEESWIPLKNLDDSFAEVKKK